MAGGRLARRAHSLSLSAGLNIDASSVGLWHLDRVWTRGNYRLGITHLVSAKMAAGTTHAALSVVGARQDGPRRWSPSRTATCNTVVTDFIHTMPLLSFCLLSEDFTWKPSIVMLTDNLRWTVDLAARHCVRLCACGYCSPYSHSKCLCRQ